MSTMQTKVTDIWECSTPITFIDESENQKKLVDGDHIIGRVEAECFFLDKTSRNKRHYTESLWRNVLKDKELNERLESKAVYGTIGHDQELDDIALRDGKFSHILSKMWITEDRKGMGEFLILGTPTGKNLNTILRAGGKIYLSTRAMGMYEKKQATDGSDVLALEGFKLQTIDFVTSPGFLDAAPTIIESTNNQQIEKGQIMPPETTDFIEHLKTENKAIKVERDQLIAKQLEDASTLKKVQKELDEYRAIGTVSALEQLPIGKLLKDPIVYRSGGVEAVIERLKKYEELGTPEKIGEALEKGTSSILELQKYREEFGTADKIKAALNVSKTVGESFKENVEKLASYEALGTPAQFSHLQTQVEELRDKNSKLQNGANTFSKSASDFLQTHGFESFENAKDILDVTFHLVNRSGRPFSDFEKFVESALAFEKNVGTFEDAENHLTKQFDFAKEIGDLDEAKEFLEESLDFIENIGTLKQARKLLEESLDFVENIGTLKQAKVCLEETQDFVENVGPFNAVTQIINRVESFTSRNGNFDVIESVLLASENALIQVEESLKTEKAQQLSDSLGVSESKVLSLLNKGLTDVEIADIFDKRLQTQVRESVSKSPRGRDYLNPTTKVTESSQSEIFNLNRNLASRLMQGN